CGYSGAAGRRATARFSSGKSRDNIPDEPQIDAPVAVDQTIAKRDNLRPRNPRASPYLWEKPARRLPDDLEIANDRILHQPLAQQHVATAGSIGFTRLDAVRNMTEIRTVAFHRGRASASTNGRKNGLRLRSATRSTRRPYGCSNSSTNARSSPKPLASARSTRRSMSLPGRSSPRATEPNRRISEAPWRAAIAAIASRCRCNSSRSFTARPRRGTGPARQGRRRNGG